MAGNKDKLRGGLNALFGEAAATPTSTAPKEELIAAVKDEELRQALKAKREEHRGRPRKTEEQRKASEGYSRTSLIVNTEKAAKIKEIAFRQTLTMKEVFELAMDLLIEKYEAAHGRVIPNPEKYKGSIDNIFKK
jgi:hypothetical protein